MQRTPQSVPSTYLFPAIVFLLIAQPVVASLFAAESDLLVIPLVVTLVAVIWSIDTSTHWLRAGIGLGIAALATLLASVLSPSWGLAAATGVLIAVLGGLCVILGIRSLFRSGQVTIESLLMAMSVYLLLGAVFGLVFDLLNSLEHGWFHGVSPAGRAAETAELVYFSIGTLTGTAYGDILPVHPLARLLTNVEAVVGQMYVAVLVARLVSGYVGGKEASGA